MSEEVKNTDLEETVEETVEEAVEETVEETVEEVEEKVEVKEDDAEPEKKGKKKNEPEMSKSKQKRETRKAEAKAAKKRKVVGRIIEIVIEVAIAALFGCAIIMGIIQSARKVTASSDYSANLTEEGYIEGQDLSTVKDLGLTSLVVPADSVVPTDETIEEKINSALEAHKELSTDSSLEAATGDKINLDYVGTVDGVAFEGGDTQGNGTDLELGSGSYVDDFEDQLVGAHPGDQLTVEVTFPDDYKSEDLQGKDAKFEVTVNGIYTTPEFNDEFVQAYYSDEASTAEEYRQKLYDDEYDKNLENYILEYVSDNASVSKYPKGYVKIKKALLYNADLESYNYMNQMYSYYGMGALEFFGKDGYAGMGQNEYFKELTSRAKKMIATSMTYDSLFINEGLEISDEAYQDVLTQYGGEETAVSEFGAPYLHMIARQNTVVEYLKGKVTVQ